MFRVAQLFYFAIDSGMSLAFQSVKPLDDAIEGLGLIFVALPQAALFRAGRTSVKYRRAGTLRLLTIAAKERIAQFPNVPILHEFGIDIDMGPWMGIFGPAGMPADIVNRLHDAIDATLREPQIVVQILVLQPLRGWRREGFAGPRLQPDRGPRTTPQDAADMG